MKLKKLSIAVVALLASASFAQVNVVSTQLRPVQEIEKVRTILVKDAKPEINYIGEDPNTYMTRMLAESQASTGKVHVTIALDSELSPLNSAGALQDIDDVMNRLSTSREFSGSFKDLAKMGGNNTRFIPFLTNTFQMAANKKALQYLPAGANINNLTWAQTIQWAKNMKAATGEDKFGLPGGPTGLIHRFFQGYALPAYTGGVVRNFKSADAEKMWADLKDLWTVTNKRSTSYNAMEEPLKTGEVWVAFDHTARLLPALNDKPDDFVAFPAPAGPKGRFFMPVISGLSIPKNTPDRVASEAAIAHLTSPAVQAKALAEVGWFPTVKADIGTLPRGVQVAALGVGQTFSAPGARGALLPSGLGAKNGEFNKVFIDSFQRIIVRNEDVKTVLAQQGQALADVMKEANAKCWAPDASSGTAPCPVQ
ncbi:ABC transporter substrate-binding protein [Variovorax sp. PCZ-1]|uniref:ABC transporter substrate-binding protein n=1 Tax=Variovorax sp. PCZ-1 TaxID=2835533 RepID=UPI001BCF319D|nr:ABC transporter substrate-binding protein [Variovorax sp. PCZ-1]MBS7806095.1 carbohydrate ABC transporter substrate-binding protein [Variovorax sp. PCZ-1]